MRFPPGLAKSLCKTSPALYTQHARNPARNVEIGGDNMVFAPNYGSPFVTCLDKGRRYGTIEDFRNFVKLAYMSPFIHHSGGTVCEPVDLPVNKRHLDMVYAHMALSDKPFMGSVTHPERAQDTVAMCEILFGEEFIQSHTVCTSLINANSPLVWDATMLGAAEAYAANNQACIITPFILSGAMSPVTMAATLTQVLAEVWTGTAFCQLVRPGAPVVFGTFVSTLSMQSGAPTFGTPEATLAIFGAAQLARRMNMPFRTGGSLCASKSAGCAGRLRERADAAADHPGRHQFRAARGGLARGRAVGELREIRHGLRPARHHARAGQGLRHLRERAGHGRLPRGRTRRPLPRLRPHPGEFRDGVLSLRRSPTTTPSSSGRPKGSLDMAQRANRQWKKMLAEYVRRRSTRRSTRRCRSSWRRRKASMPDATH